MSRRRIVAQVACEYVINHGGDGFDPETIEAIRVEAVEAGVARLYVDMLPEPETSAP